jgi:hypothetical protein
VCVSERIPFKEIEANEGSGRSASQVMNAITCRGVYNLPPHQTLDAILNVRTSATSVHSSVIAKPCSFTCDRKNVSIQV